MIADYCFTGLLVYSWFDFLKHFVEIIIGEKKLGKVITPDTWKDGARNTTGKHVLFVLNVLFLLLFLLFKQHLNNRIFSIVT